MSDTYTLPQLNALGFTHKRADGKKLCDGHDIAITLGERPDGTNLVMFDLDKHNETQDPGKALQAFQDLPFANKMAVKRSTSLTGYHVVAITPEPTLNNQQFFIGGHHAGEVFCQGGHMPMPCKWIFSGHVTEPVTESVWVWGNFETLELLTKDEFEAFTLFATTQTGTRKPDSRTARMREGMPLIHGYERISTDEYRTSNGMPKTFDGAKQTHRIAQANYRNVKTARKGERSTAYANYVQSLAILGSTYGHTIEARCRVIAALAIEDCPERGEKDFDAEKDTAVLVARIIHGSPFRNGLGNFTIPHWARSYKPPVNQRGRPAGARTERLDAVRRLLLRNADGGNQVAALHTKRGPAKLTVGALAKTLKVDERTMRGYLVELEAQHEICRNPTIGRTGGMEIFLLPSFNQPVKPDHKCTENQIINVQKTGSWMPDTMLPDALNNDSTTYITSKLPAANVSDSGSLFGALFLSPYRYPCHRPSDADLWDADLRNADLQAADSSPALDPLAPGSPTVHGSRLGSSSLRKQVVRREGNAPQTLPRTWRELPSVSNIASSPLATAPP